MTRLIWIVLILLLSAGLVMAQATCPALDDALLAALETCEDAVRGTLCYAAGEITLETDTEESVFDAVGDTVLLQDVIAIETESEGDDLAVAIMQLNREDIALRLIAFGDISLENTAPRSSITVYTLRGVNVRQQPSREGTVIGSLVQGRNYTAIGRLADNTWIQVVTEDGRVGWSSAQYFVTQAGFTALEVVTPNTPPYLPMQALRVQTDACGGLLLLAPELEEEAIIFGINGAQIQVNGVVWIRASDDVLRIVSLEGEHVLNAFGFEVSLAQGEMASIPLNDAGSIVGIPGDVEAVAVDLLDDETLSALLE